MGGEGWPRKEKKETKEKEQTRGQPGNRKQQDFEHKVRPDWAKGERHALGGSSYGCLYALMRRNSDRCLVAEDRWTRPSVVFPEDLVVCCRSKVGANHPAVSSPCSSFSLYNKFGDISNRPWSKLLWTSNDGKLTTTADKGDHFPRSITAPSNSRLLNRVFGSQAGAILGRKSPTKMFFIL